MFTQLFAATASDQGAAIGWLKTYDTVNLVNKVITPIVYIALLVGVIVALFLRFKGTVNAAGERQTMSKKTFWTLIPIAIAITVATTVLVVWINVWLLKENSGILEWSGYNTYSALKQAAGQP